MNLPEDQRVGTDGESHKLGYLVCVSLLTVLGILTGCTPLAALKQREIASPRLIKASSGNDQQLVASLREAQKLAKKVPLAALDIHLSNAQKSAITLQRAPSDKAALELYNFSVARAIEVLLDQGIEPWGTASPKSTFEITYKGDRRSPHHPSNYDFIATDTLQFSGKYFTERGLINGIGATFVAVAKKERKEARSEYGMTREYGCATAVIRFTGNRAQIQWYEPWQQQSTVFAGKEFPIAADFTAPLAKFMVDNKPQQFGLNRLLKPDRYHGTTALTRLQPYDPNRIPVLLVHGLDSTPATWVPMINGLRADPEIQRRYQFWVFSHASGYAYPYTASLLRKELDGIAKQFPDHKPILLVGHSMGGLIGRLMVTDVQDKLWMSYFGKPPEKVSLLGSSADILKDSIIFDSREEVSRVVFICSPHRGSKIASSFIGRFASRLVGSPKLLADISESVFAIMTVNPAALRLNHMPNSIDTLAPNNRFVMEINKIPISSRVPYHSIIGDRGRGDTPDSSDGAVPYWSSHLEGAVSEKIVPHGHGSHQTPEGIAEMRRIMQLHAGIKGSKPRLSKSQ